MTTIELHNTTRAGRSAASRLTALATHGATRLVTAWRDHTRRRRDRAAFMNLVGKEEWVYRDMGISRADVEWAARLPMHVNAAEELERIRARSMSGR